MDKSKLKSLNYLQVDCVLTNITYEALKTYFLKCYIFHTEIYLLSFQTQNIFCILYRNSGGYNDKHFLFIEYSVITYNGDLFLLITHRQKNKNLCNLLERRTIFCNALITHTENNQNTTCNQPQEKSTFSNNRFTPHRRIKTSCNQMERTICLCNHQNQHYIDSVMYIQQFKYGKISFFGSQGPQTIYYKYYGLIKFCIQVEISTKPLLTIVKICQSALLNVGVICIPTHNSSILGVNKNDC